MRSIAVMLAVVMVFAPVSVANLAYGDDSATSGVSGEAILEGGDTYQLCEKIVRDAAANAISVTITNPCDPKTKNVDGVFAAPPSDKNEEGKKIVECGKLVCCMGSNLKGDADGFKKCWDDKKCDACKVDGTGCSVCVIPRGNTQTNQVTVNSCKRACYEGNNDECMKAGKDAQVHLINELKGLMYNSNDGSNPCDKVPREEVSDCRAKTGYGAEVLQNLADLYRTGQGAVQAVQAAPPAPSVSPAPATPAASPPVSRAVQSSGSSAIVSSEKPAASFGGSSSATPDLPEEGLSTIRLDASAPAPEEDGQPIWSWSFMPTSSTIPTQATIPARAVNKQNLLEHRECWTDHQMLAMTKVERDKIRDPAALKRLADKDYVEFTPEQMFIGGSQYGSDFIPDNYKSRVDASLMKPWIAGARAGDKELKPGSVELLSREAQDEVGRIVRGEVSSTGTSGGGANEYSGGGALGTLAQAGGAAAAIQQ
ncbi:hypothetical protein HY641_05150, partial [Candidatus Woesearchaeota archaeon]|nr:hypothetical protein [Candidatus Woesearchaeota archaeon]